MQPQPYRHIDVERHGNIACARLRQRRLLANEVDELGGELLHLVSDGGCPFVALRLGPDRPEFIYSVFLSYLIRLQRVSKEQGGGLKLCACAPSVLDVLEACKLRDRFDYAADEGSAIAAWQKA